MLPHDFPPWEAVYQQTQRWLSGGVFQAVAHDLRVLLRRAEGRALELQPRLGQPHVALASRERPTRHKARVMTSESESFFRLS